MSTLESKLTHEREVTGSRRPRATLAQLQRWHRYEVLAGPENDPVTIVTIGAERFVWERVSKGQYERLGDSP